MVWLPAGFQRCVGNAATERVPGKKRGESMGWFRDEALNQFLRHLKLRSQILNVFNGKPGHWFDLLSHNQKTRI